MEMKPGGPYGTLTIGGHPNVNPYLMENVYRSDLVSRATQVVMWYGSKRYYGYFTSFSVTEAASAPGEYTYQLGYKVWKTVGRDRNYMPWHRSPSQTMPHYPGESPGWTVGTHALLGADDLSFRKSKADKLLPVTREETNAGPHVVTNDEAKKEAGMISVRMGGVPEGATVARPANSTSRKSPLGKLDAAYKVMTGGETENGG